MVRGGYEWGTGLWGAMALSLAGLRLQPLWGTAGGARYHKSKTFRKRKSNRATISARVRRKHRRAA